MKSKTDKTPAVGAVAWWAAGDGVGSSGHVAVVEKVVSATQIVISEDSWSGTFHWRTITKDGRGWPTGFIHLADKKASTPTPTPPPPQAPVALANTAAPSITGTPQVGVPLQASPGTWNATGTAFAYQWLAGDVPIAGATGATFTPTQAQNGATLRVQVTASRSGYTAASAVSPPTGKVGGGSLQSNGAPTVTGVGQVGEVLTATSAGWTPQPTTAAFRWRADGKIMAKQSGATLTLTREMLGKTITVTEIARSDGMDKGEAAASNPVGPVVSGVITTPANFAASGQPKLGSSLQLTPGTVEPADTAVRYEWLRDGQVIAGATGPAYQLTPADAGRRVVGQVVLSRPEYAEVRRTFEFGVVSTTSELTVKAKSKRRAVALGVHLTAPGMGGVNGPITVKIGKREVRGTLENGFARVLVPHLRPGERKIRVFYAGTEAVSAAKAAARVRVERT